MESVEIGQSPHKASQNACEMTPASGERHTVAHSASGGALLTSGVISDVQRGAKNSVCRVQPSSPHHAANQAARRELAHSVLRSYRRVTAHEHRGGPVLRKAGTLSAHSFLSPASQVKFFINGLRVLRGQSQPFCTLLTLFRFPLTTNPQRHFFLLSVLKGERERSLHTSSMCIGTTCMLSRSLCLRILP